MVITLDRFLHLSGKQGAGEDSHPAVQRIEVWCVIGIVVVEHGTQAHNGEDQREEEEAGMENLPWQFVLSPGQWDTIHHSGWDNKDDIFD